MLLGTLTHVVRRRWYVVLVGVLITGVAAVAVASLEPPRYSVSATALLLPPKVSSEGKETNPYLQLGGLTTAVDVLARALNDPRVHDKIIKQGEAGDYVAQRDFLTAAPLLVVTAESTTADRAREIRDAVMEAAPEVLSELQASVGVPVDSRPSPLNDLYGRVGRARVQDSTACDHRRGGGRSGVVAARRWRRRRLAHSTEGAPIRGSCGSRRGMNGQVVRMETPTHATTRDALGLLTLGAALNLAVPSRYTLGPLGGAGAPATLVGVVALGGWLFLHVSRPFPRPVVRQPFRAALLLFLGAVMASFVVVASRPGGISETWSSLFAIVVLVSWVGTILFATDFLLGWRSISLLISRLTTMAGLYALLGIFQYFTTLPLTNYFSVLPRAHLEPGTGQHRHARRTRTGLHPRPSTPLSSGWCSRRYSHFVSTFCCMGESYLDGGVTPPPLRSLRPSRCASHGRRSSAARSQCWHCCPPGNRGLGLAVSLLSASERWPPSSWRPVSSGPFRGSS